MLRLLIAAALLLAATSADDSFAPLLDNVKEGYAQGAGYTAEIEEDSPTSYGKGYGDNGPSDSIQDLHAKYQAAVSKAEAVAGSALKYAADSLGEQMQDKPGGAQETYKP